MRKGRTFLKALALLAVMAVCGLPVSAQVVDLGGTWHVVLENDGSGHDVTLPGSLLTNNLGEEPSVDTRWTGSIYDSSFYYNPAMEPYRQPGRMKFPFFLTPNRHYVGTAVYTRTVFVPAEWAGRHVTLFLERPHIETTVFVNGREAGHQMSLSTPHVYDLTSLVEPGRENKIAVAVYNGIENVCVGQDSHSVTDQTQGNWNGIVGRMELRAEPTVRLSAVQAFPDVAGKSVRVRATLEADQGSTDGFRGTLAFRVGTGRRKVRPCTVAEGTAIVEDTLPMGDDVRLWDEFSPNLYVLEVTLAKGDSVVDRREVTFGMREVGVRDMDLTINGHALYVRGTVENCDFPLTGYPPTDVESWRRLFAKCRQYGLNAMRFHSYCPPEAAFTAADETGFYLAPEGPSWPNHGVRMNQGMAIDTYLMDETRRMAEAYGNHPSFIMMSAGNEPAGDWVAWGDKWVDYWKAADSRRVYASFNVGGGWAWDGGSQYHVKGGARGLDWDKAAPQSMDDYLEQIRRPRNYRASVPNNSPMISHEQGQWCAFPDLDERGQYTGVYKARNFDIFADLLKRHGMEAMGRKFLYASGKLQTLCYKYEIERNLRTSGYAGFMLLGLNDYSGQGTALVGPLNVFWREKGYVDSTAWRQFCNAVVVMAEFPKFVFSSGEEASVAIDVYNALGGTALEGAELSYAISPMVARTVVGSFHVPGGKSRGIAQVPLCTDAAGPGKYTLELRLRWNGKTYANTYDYWVYPKEPVMKVPEDIYMTDTLDSQAVKVLESGGKVLVAAAGKVRYGNDVRQHYLPVFWNTSWFKMRPPHTTGACIDAGHPLFREFPTDNWGNLNWWELLNNAQVMNLAGLPASYQPPVQPIDTWHVSRKLGMVIEAKVLKGRLLMTTMDIGSGLDTRLVARQMRKAVMDYMESDDFRPSLSLDVHTISDLFTKTAPAVDMHTNDSPDELKPKLK